VYWTHRTTSLITSRSPTSPTQLTPFSFQRAGESLELHSFPTRRSSDLVARSITSRSLAPADGNIGSRWTIAWTPRTTSCANSRRSEEHTSELQSLRHLVCRLLLEKKKNSPSCTANVIRIRRVVRYCVDL